MNIKDAYIHNGEAILKDIQISGSKLQKLKAGKNADDTYLTWVDVLDLSPFGASGHNHDDRYVKKSGDTMTGLLTTTSGGNHRGIKVGDTYINAIGSDLIFQNNGTIRFGGDSWDYNVWAGLKYVHSSKTIYLGLADGSAFTANSAQSGGKLYTPGISDIYIGNGTYTVYHTNNLSIKTLMGTTAIGDADEPVYWNGSSFVKAGAYPTKASWNYDDRYLKLSGGTLSGEITFKYGSNHTDQFIQFSSTDSNDPQTVYLGIRRPISSYGLCYKDNKGNLYDLIHSGNYTTYTVKKDGTGATGTWGISITGNAKTATSLGSGALKYMCSLYTTNTYNAYKIVTDWHKSNNAMPTINIRGYAYGTSKTIDCDIVMYHYNNGACGYSLTNKGSYSIRVWQAIENDVQVFYINPREYFGMFNVFVYGGMSTNAFSNWSMTTVDEVSGTEIDSKPIATSITGNASTSSTWKTARTITLTGSVTGSVSIDGSANVSLATTTNHTHTKSQITDFPTSLPANGGYANEIASKGMLDSQEKIDNFITPNRFEYALFKTTDANNVDFASNDGMIISIPWASDSYGVQLAFDDTRNGTIKVRGKSNTWGNWYTLLHSGNYTSYTVKKDGTGASGTWGISITGNAKTATNANYATSASNADTVDNYHAKSAGSLFYKYEVTATIPASSVTGDFWYATITFERNYVAELTRSILSASYSNTAGQVYLNTYTYNGSWYAFTSHFNGSNIKGISFKQQNNPIYYVKLAKPTIFNNVVENGKITVYSPYNCTITVSAIAPSGVTFTNINCPGFTNLKANSAYSADSATTTTYASNVGSSGTAGTNYVTASKVISACNWYDTMIGSDSDTVINRWSEIVAFVAGFKETPDLATFLSNNYLAKAGGTMTGPLKWKDNNALPQQTSPQYFLCIDAFDDGGTTKWTSKADTLKALTGLTSTAIGDSDEPVYWNGSKFVKAGAYPTKSSWNYDDRYLKLSGGTLTGVLHLLGSKYEDSANTGAIDLANSDIYGVNSIKFADLAESAGEGLQWYRDATHVDSLWVNSGVIYFSPNRTWGGTVTNYTVWHSGNDGTGSGLDADLLDGKHASDFSLSTHTHDYIAKLRRLNEVFGYSSFASGMFPPALFELKTAGYPVYSDPEFASGYNSVYVYNNYGNGTVTITREQAGDHTNSSGFQLKITTAGEATPGCGGFYQSISSRANAIFVQIFRAKIPVGYNVNTASNSMGTIYQDKFITDRAGTGKWEWYARVVYCDSSGSFSSGGHVYLSANSGYSATSVTWYLSYCNVIDITKGAYDGLRTRYADSADSVVWGNIIEKPTTISGYGITDAYTKIQIDTKFNGYLPLNGGELTGKTAIIGQNTGASTISADLDALIIANKQHRVASAGYYYPGIAFNHMWNWDANKTYQNSSQAWIGLKLHSTPGSELSYLVFGTKEGTGTADRPIERMSIAPNGDVNIKENLSVDGSISATTLYENGVRVSIDGHTHTKSQITDFPTSLPANGGNADTVDNFHASAFYENGYVMFGYTIDASKLDVNTWYPVIISIGTKPTVRIEVRVSLDSGTKPSWSFHELGFSVRKIWEVNGSGWGTNRINRRILESDYSFTSTDPVRGIGQLSNSSIEYVYVRGGGKYYFYISHNVSCTLCTTPYTIYEQSVEPTTTAPSPININVGYYCSNAGNATTATNVAWSGITNKPTFITWSETSSTASYSLSNAAWTNTITLPTTAGSYVLNIVSGNSTLTGVFSIGASDNAKDEISLHLHGNGPRLYARTNGTTLQLSSNDTSATSRSVTIKYRRMI